MSAGEQSSTPPKVMLETWLRESNLRLPTKVMFETWLRDSNLRLLTKVMLETCLRDSLVVYRTRTSTCHA